MHVLLTIVLAGTGLVSIPEIQGAGHESPWEGRNIRTRGMVTAVDPRGFHLQDEEGDDDPATSDGIYVFMGERPRVAAGERLAVQATVKEWVPGGVRTANLSVTELIDVTIQRLSRGHELPDPIEIGPQGRMPPDAVIDDDGLARYDPIEDAIDFYESLEGMRVRIPRPVAVSALNHHGELFVLPADGSGASGRNPRSGITISPGDFNPERLQVQLDRHRRQAVDAGARLYDVIGIIGYAYGNFEVRVSTLRIRATSRLQRETTALESDGAHLTIATFNLCNLGAEQCGGARHGRYALLARQLVSHLRAPDIVAVQEVQAGAGNARRLIAEIIALGGPGYRYADVRSRDGNDGGAPGADIRPGLLFNPARVGLVPGSLRLIADADPADGDAFAGSRKPLAAEFVFNGRRLIVVNVHFSSKRGSSPLFGRIQPPVDRNAERRAAQATEVAAFVRGVAGRADGMVVLGDFNDFWFSPPLDLLRRSGGLVNLMSTLPEPERYTFIFEGNAQALDHVLVSPALARQAELDIVHVNAEFAEQASDHDPVVVRMHLP
ncbi:hypothetical protein BH24PSE2_BH24PSE2_18770 [soil metagenome]